MAHSALHVTETLADVFGSAAIKLLGRCAASDPAVATVALAAARTRPAVTVRPAELA